MKGSSFLQLQVLFSHPLAFVFGFGICLAIFLSVRSSVSDVIYPAIPGVQQEIQKNKCAKASVWDGKIWMRGHQTPPSKTAAQFFQSLQLRGITDAPSSSSGSLDWPMYLQFFTNLKTLFITDSTLNAEAIGHLTDHQSIQRICFLNCQFSSSIEGLTSPNQSINRIEFRGCLFNQAEILKLACTEISTLVSVDEKRSKTEADSGAHRQFTKIHTGDQHIQAFRDANPGFYNDKLELCVGNRNQIQQLRNELPWLKTSPRYVDQALLWQIYPALLIPFICTGFFHSIGRSFEESHLIKILPHAKNRLKQIHFWSLVLVSLVTLSLLLRLEIPWHTSLISLSFVFGLCLLTFAATNVGIQLEQITAIFLGGIFVISILLGSMSAEETLLQLFGGRLFLIEILLLFGSLGMFGVSAAVINAYWYCNSFGVNTDRQVDKKNQYFKSKKTNWISIFFRNLTLANLNRSPMSIQKANKIQVAHDYELTNGNDSWILISFFSLMVFSRLLNTSILPLLFIWLVFYSAYRIISNRKIEDRVDFIPFESTILNRENVISIHLKQILFSSLQNSFFPILFLVLFSFRSSPGSVLIQSLFLLSLFFMAIALLLMVERISALFFFHTSPPNRSTIQVGKLAFVFCFLIYGCVQANPFNSSFSLFVKEGEGLAMTSLQPISHVAMTFYILILSTLGFSFFFLAQKLWKTGDVL